MKTRSGFVSNSSSTSYAILLPADAKFNVSGFDDSVIADAKNAFDELKASKADLYFESLGGEDPYETGDALVEALQPYIIAEFDSGPDEGQVVHADMNKVRKILGQ